MGNAARRHANMPRAKAVSESAPKPVVGPEDTNFKIALSEADSVSHEELEAAEKIFDREVAAQQAEPESPAPVVTDAATTEQTTPVEGEATTTAEAPVKKAKPMPTFEEALAKAKQDNPSRFAPVIEVTELTQRGEPKRVVIKCQDPQTKMVGDKEVSVCVGTREIAVQDLFQVTRCLPCADRKVRKQRRQKNKEKVKALKKVIRDAKNSR